VAPDSSYTVLRSRKGRNYRQLPARERRRENRFLPKSSSYTIYRFGIGGKCRDTFPSWGLPFGGYFWMTGDLRFEHRHWRMNGVPRLRRSTILVSVSPALPGWADVWPRPLRQAQGRLYGPVSVLRFVSAFSHTLFSPSQVPSYTARLKSCPDAKQNTKPKELLLADHTLSTQKMQKLQGTAFSRVRPD
jgi:hypothetical protein